MIIVISISVVFCSLQTELEEAADFVLFLMDHTFLADDHLALNETTFTWPDRIIPIINMRYVRLKSMNLGLFVTLLSSEHECQLQH